MAVEIGTPRTAKVDDDATQAELATLRGLVATAARQDLAYARLQAIVDAVNTRLAPGGAVSISNLPLEYPLPVDQESRLRSVTVGNLPADYPLPAAQVTALTPPATFPLPDAQLEALRPAVDAPSETRMDYATRTDGNPVYVGKADQGTATTATTWTIQRLEYDGSARLVRVQTLTGAWDSRATLGWAV